MRLSPHDAFLSDFDLYNAFAHFQGANYDAGLEHAEQASRLRPGHAYPLLLAATCAGHLGLTARGGAHLAAFMLLQPAVSPGWVEATSPYVLAADRSRFVAGLVRSGLC